ncbi:DUF3298 and DUF4163 domain-containing protein [Sphingobacterium griseoflavum]|uniref:DUF3298 domain-containing protein n=1 Tax=Sphingobacterium griseoflavum TaxID=1474952 RepID=A0ABQ3HV12_9SPHI|nr:DUF3298 and DUF4163 domain-containing protein [Sphingobacterium griseoflavum]GHE34103.1 hypothetical protein GCM10017764_16770 [Sphingobacterium griseoflavum]
MGKCVLKFLTEGKSRLLLLALAILMVSGCFSDRKSESASHVTTERAPADTLHYEIKQFKAFSPYLSGTEMEVDSTIFTARYPVFEAEINDLVQQAIFIDGESKVEQVSDSFLGGFNEYAEEQIDAGNEAFHTWFKHQDSKVILNEGGILTLQTAINDYTGGAHGMEIELWFSFDVPAKKRLALTDLVADTTQLLQIAERRFKKMENLSDTASYGSSYFFDNENFVLPENFGLTKDGLLFHYNPYEIKSYAEGPTTLVIPYSALLDVLTEKGRKLFDGLSDKT